MRFIRFSRKATQVRIGAAGPHRDDSARASPRLMSGARFGYCTKVAWPGDSP
jgi:hypothetical protein